MFFSLLLVMTYDDLKNTSVKILTVPISTAIIERFFSAMNRIMTPLRNRLGDSSLDHCMKISTEGEEIPSEEFLRKRIQRYAIKRQRRVRLL